MLTTPLLHDYGLYEFTLIVRTAVTGTPSMTAERGQRVVVFGVGDFARIADFYFRHDSPYRVVAHTVMTDSEAASEFLGVPVVPFERLAGEYPPGAPGN